MTSEEEFKRIEDLKELEKHLVDLLGYAMTGLNYSLATPVLEIDDFTSINCHVPCTILADPLIRLSNVQLSRSGTGPPDMDEQARSQLAMKP